MRGTRRYALAVLVLALTIVGCGASPEDPFEGLAVYDESIPETAFEQFYVAHEDFRAMSRSSELIVVGSLAGYDQNVLTQEADEEDPEQLKTVFDGYVFVVDEVIKGDIAVGDEVRIATTSLMLNSDDSPRYRIPETEVAALFEEGMVRRVGKDHADYVLYAVNFEGEDLYRLNTPGGAAQVFDDGRIGQGALWPMARSTEDGHHSHGPTTHRHGEGISVPSFDADRMALAGDTLSLADLRAVVDEG